MGHKSLDNSHVPFILYFNLYQFGFSHTSIENNKINGTVYAGRVGLNLFHSKGKDWVWHKV